MGFLSLIIALLVEQVRPLQNDNAAYMAVRNVAAVLERNFNAGEKQQGILAWLLLVLPLTLGSWLIFYLLVRAHPFLGLGWNVFILYLTLGFRQFSHYYTDIQIALANQDLIEARRILTQWKSLRDEKFSAADLDISEVSRLSIEEALMASHRHVFGVLFWFVVLPGPCGAVLYRVANYLARNWIKSPVPVSSKVSESSEAIQPEVFGHFAQQFFNWIDWIPVRLSAIGFAIVGNFEDAIFCWRNHAGQWKDASQGVLLAAGGGALGVRLGDTESPAKMAEIEVSDTVIEATLEPAPTMDGTADTTVEIMPGVEASPAAMRSAVGLVWRSILLWLILLLLLSLAGLFG